MPDDPIIDQVDDLGAPEGAPETTEQTLGPDATLDEVFAGGVPEAAAWLEQHHAGKTFAQLAAERASATQTPAASDEGTTTTDQPNDEPEFDLEGLDERELKELLDDVEDRITDPRAALEVKELRERGGPDGSPSRLKALRHAAARALDVAGPIKTFQYPESGQTTFIEPLTGDSVTMALDQFGRRTREIARKTAAEVEEAIAARDAGPEEVDPATIKLSDVAGWNAREWAAFAEAHPEAADRLRRAEGDARSKQAENIIF